MPQKKKNTLNLNKLAKELGFMSKHPGKSQCPSCGKWISNSSNRGHRCK